MTPQLVEIEAYDILTASPLMVRIADGPSAETFGVGGFSWSPAILKRAVMTVEILSIDLNARIQSGKASITLDRRALRSLPTSRLVKWTGAAIRIYSARDLSYDRKVLEFQGRITDNNFNPDSFDLSLSAEVDTDYLDKPLLTKTMTGQGGVNGTADMIGTLMPAGFGICENIEPVWIDKTRWIGMIDGYGNTISINKLMEGASSWGNRVASYPDFASLAAAIDNKDVKPGQWAACVPLGLIGLGAPPAKPIGVNATFGSGTSGSLISRAVLTHAAAPAALVDGASLTALDAMVPYPIHYWTAEQRNVDDLVQAVARAANATALVNCQGQLQVLKNTASGAVATLNRSGGTLPRVIGWQTTTPVAPFWQIKMRCSRPANVLDLTDVLFDDDLVDMYAFREDTLYRLGNIVTMPNKSRWLYINPEPHLGQGITPPNPSYWQNMEGPVAYADGTPLDDLRPATPGADKTEDALNDAMDSITGQTAAQVVFALNRAVDAIAEEVMRGATWRGEADQIIYTGDGTPVRTVVEAIGSTTDEHTVFVAFLKEVSADGTGRFSIAARSDGTIVGIDGMAGPNFGQLSFAAPKFLFVDSSGQNPTAVLTYANGVWKMGSIEVDTLRVGTVLTDSIGLNQVTQKQYWSAKYAGVDGTTMAPNTGTWYEFGATGNKAKIQATTTGVIPAGSEVTLRMLVTSERQGGNDDRMSWRIRRDGPGGSDYIGDVLTGGAANSPMTTPYEWQDQVDSTGAYTYFLEFRRDTGNGIYHGAKLISDIGKR